MNDNDVLVRVENVSKKFCRDFKTSLLYGLKDFYNELQSNSNRRINDLRPKEFWAIKDVCFELKRGECLGLVGCNGAGKTTLLRLLNGLIKPDSGRIEIHGRVSAMIALGVGFNPILTGRENIHVNGSILGLSKANIDERFDEIVEFSGIGEFIDAPVQTYSSGMSVRLGFSVAAVLLQPDILLLDEILAVGDARFQVKCINTVRKLQSNGVSIILVSHNIMNLLRYCDTGLYLANGKIKSKGSINEITDLYLQDQHPAEIKESIDNIETDSGFILHKAYVTDEDNRKLLKISSPFQKIIIHVPFEIHKEIGNSLIQIALGINDFEGLYYRGTSENMKFSTESNCTHGEILIAINGLRSKSSVLNYSVTLWLLPENTLLAWSRDNNIAVSYESINPGRIELESTWSIVFPTNTKNNTQRKG